MSAIDAWRLPDGTPLELRALRGDDATALNAGLASLSPEDRRRRFHGAVKGLSEAAVRRLAEADPERRQSWIAVTEDGAVAAEAMWALDETTRAAEAAFVVMPRWRRQGVAWRIVQALQRRSWQRGLAWVYGHVLEDNAPLAGLLRRLGPRVATRFVGAGVLRAEWPLAR